MKKLLFFLLICLFSCTKVEDFCWECELVRLYKLDTCNPELTIEVFTMCNKTDAEIRDFERTYTYIICSNSSILKCKKNE